MTFLLSNGRQLIAIPVLLLALSACRTGRGDFDPYAEAGRAYERKDFKKAAALWKVVAEREDFDYAQGLLAVMYFDGRPGVPRDYYESFKWATKAITKDRMGPAFTTLGLLYETGRGVPQDREKAYAFLTRAAALGERRAIDYLADREAHYATLLARHEVPETTAEVLPPVDVPRYALPEDPLRFAIVIGVEKYKDLPPASFAEHDARAVQKHFLAMGVPRKNMIVLIGEDATKARIEGYMTSWLKTNIARGSTVYFYFSGHGTADAERSTPVIVPWDADPNLLGATGIPIASLTGALGALEASSVAIVDSCFSGSGGRSVIPKGARPLLPVVTSERVPSNVILITAAEGTQIAGSLETAKHGLFTYYFLRGIDDWGQTRKTVDMPAVVEIMRPQVEQSARRNGRNQTPRVLRGNF